MRPGWLTSPPQESSPAPSGHAKGGEGLASEGRKAQQGTDTVTGVSAFDLCPERLARSEPAILRALRPTPQIRLALVHAALPSTTQARQLSPGNAAQEDP